MPDPDDHLLAVLSELREALERSIEVLSLLSTETRVASATTTGPSLGVEATVECVPTSLDKEVLGDGPARASAATPQPASAADTPAGSGFDLLAAWLAKRGARIVRHRPTAPADRPLDRLARRIGDQPELLGPLPAALRRAVSRDRPQTVHLRDESVATIGAATSLSRDMHELGLLSHCYYERACRQLHVRVAAAGRELLGGGWLERWAASVVRESLTAASAPGTVLRGLELAFADGTEAELDLLVKGPVAEPVWIECRTGRYQDSLERDARLRRMLDIPSARSLLVLAGAEADTRRELSAIHGMRVLGPAELLSAAGALLAAPGGGGLVAPREPHTVREAPPVEPAVPVATAPLEAESGTPTPAIARPADVERVRGLLRQAGVRVHADRRRQALQALVELMRRQPGRTLRELKIALSDAASISRTAANELILALLRGGALSAQGNGSGTTLADLVLALDTDDVGALEDGCLRSWRALLRAQDPTMLASAEGERAFRAATTAPALATAPPIARVLA